MGCCGNEFQVADGIDDKKHESRFDSVRSLQPTDSRTSNCRTGGHERREDATDANESRTTIHANGHQRAEHHGFPGPEYEECSSGQEISKIVTIACIATTDVDEKGNSSFMDFKLEEGRACWRDAGHADKMETPESEPSPAVDAFFLSVGGSQKATNACQMRTSTDDQEGCCDQALTEGGEMVDGSQRHVNRTPSNPPDPHTRYDSSRGRELRNNNNFVQGRTAGTVQLKHGTADSEAEYSVDVCAVSTWRNHFESDGVLHARTSADDQVECSRFQCSADGGLVQEKTAAGVQSQHKTKDSKVMEESKAECLDEAQECSVDVCEVGGWPNHRESEGTLHDRTSGDAGGECSRHQCITEGTEIVCESLRDAATAADNDAGAAEENRAAGVQSQNKVEDNSAIKERKAECPHGAHKDGRRHQGSKARSATPDLHTAQGNTVAGRRAFIAGELRDELDKAATPEPGAQRAQQHHPVERRIDFGTKPSSYRVAEETVHCDMHRTQSDSPLEGRTDNGRRQVRKAAEVSRRKSAIVLVCERNPGKGFFRPGGSVRKRRRSASVAMDDQHTTAAESAFRTSNKYGQMEHANLDESIASGEVSNKKTCKKESLRTRSEKPCESGQPALADERCLPSEKEGGAGQPRLSRRKTLSAFQNVNSSFDEDVHERQSHRRKSVSIVNGGKRHKQGLPRPPSDPRLLLPSAVLSGKSITSLPSLPCRPTRSGISERKGATSYSQGKSQRTSLTTLFRNAFIIPKVKTVTS
ncbi:hypothetical protein CBR_g49308 [Chara braunii]|nr:hypothetical protein CBR_g49308 [Chara braunii]|eukprot:GBG89518.1 hypothetical protein CBR_g49308 [Chara braunii]